MEIPCGSVIQSTARGQQERRVGVFFWRYDLEPEFPLRVLEYEAAPDDQMHSHDYLEVALCLAGSGKFKFGLREEPIEPGDVFLIDNSDAHIAVADPGVHLKLLLALFLPEFLAAPGCRSFDSEYLTPFMDGRASRRIHHDSQLAHEVRPILFDLKTAAEGGDPSDRYLIDANLRRFLGVVMKHQGHELAPSETAGDVQQQLSPALTYVAEHFREAITLDQVAETVHLSASRARHLFKDATTVGFKEYVTKLRLAEAKRLLLNTEINICEIASAVGYSNVYQFYKVFHRYTQMSPADYRHYYTSPSGPHVPVGLAGAGSYLAVTATADRAG
jgi:AraC-like DNA-binding protein/quercetin dioxygenase-like cupin family protein